MSISPKRYNAYFVLLVCILFILFSLGFRQSFGIYLPFVNESLGISKSYFSAAIALQNILWGVFSPIFGMYADRHGAKRVLFIGLIAYCLGLYQMANASVGSELFISQALIGLGLGGAGFAATLGAVAKVAPPGKTSIWLGFVTAAASFGQFACVHFNQWLIYVEDWRYSLEVSTWIFLLCALLLLFFNERKYLTTSKLTTTNPKPPMPINLACIVDAFKNRSYLLLTLGFFVCGFQLVFIATFLPSYLVEEKISTNVAVFTLSLIGFFNIGGSLLCGWLGSRYSKSISLAFFYSIRSVVIIIFLLVPTSEISAIMFGAAIGFLWLGTVPLTSGLVNSIFGSTYMSMLYGMVFLSHQLGSAAGVLVGGLLRDLTGNYDSIWILCIVLGFISTLLHLPIRDKPDTRFQIVGVQPTSA